jgi:hypothetical protein
LVFGFFWGFLGFIDPLAIGLGSREAASLALSSTPGFFLPKYVK